MLEKYFDKALSLGKFVFGIDNNSHTPATMQFTRWWASSNNVGLCYIDFELPRHRAGRCLIGKYKAYFATTEEQIISGISPLIARLNRHNVLNIDMITDMVKQNS